MITIGQNLLVNLPPSWLLVGRVSAIDTDEITLSPAAYCESISEPAITIFHLTREGKKPVCSTVSSIPSITLRREAIFFRCEIPRSRLLECVGQQALTALDSTV